MKPICKFDYEKAEMRRAREAFAHHAIGDRTDTSWYLAPDPQCRTGFSGVRIAALGRYLVVVGDADTCVFSGGSYSEPRDLVAWMGSTNDLHYVREKAGIGMSDLGGKITEEYDAGVMLHGLNERIGFVNDPDYGYDEEETDKLLEVLNECVESVKNYGEPGLEQAHNALCNDWPGDTEDVYRIGVVTSRRVIVAHAAVRRLWELLKAEAVATEAQGEVTA